MIWQLASGFLEYAENIRRWKILHFEQMFHVKLSEMFFTATEIRAHREICFYSDHYFLNKTL